MLCLHQIHTNLQYQQYQILPLSLIGLIVDVQESKNHAYRQKAKQFKRVIFNDPYTIVIWNDGTKSVVKTQNGEKYDPEKGLAMAIAKKAMGNDCRYYDIFKKYIEEEIK